VVNFNAWRCRNCMHWHDWYEVAKEPTGSCKQYNYNTNITCGCDNWESNDNLRYLEMKAKGD